MSTPSGASLKSVSRLPGPKAVEIFILLSCAWLLIGPRISLFDAAGSSVRLEDLIFACLAIIAVTAWTRSMRDKVGPTGILLVTLVAIAAAVVGVIGSRIGPAGGILYALRPLEYWLVLPCMVIVLSGAHAADRVRRVTRLLAIVTVAQTGVAALQYLGGFAIGFSKFSYERGAGLAAGPYELGAICALLACFWFARERYVLFALSLAGVAMSQSRISLAAVVSCCRDSRSPLALPTP